MRCAAPVCCCDPARLPCTDCDTPRVLCHLKPEHLIRMTFGGRKFCYLHYPIWHEHQGIVARIRAIPIRDIV